MFNYNASSGIAVVATVDSVVIAATELFTDVVDMKSWDQLLAIALTGDMVVGSTLDFKAYSCLANGTSATAITSATQRAADATANDNIQIVIAVRNAQVGGLGKRWVKFGIVGASTGGPVTVVVLGLGARYGSAAANDLATVVEIKQ